LRAKVLVIEDTTELADLVALYLRKEGMEVQCTESAEEALNLVKASEFDLIILDLNLPGMDGFEFLYRFRKDSKTPLLITSARSADEDVISGLGYGADEYVTKPFSPKVLVARVRAILRRETEHVTESKHFIFGDFIFDLDSFILKKGNERINLSAKETRVLCYLIEHLEKPCSPENIYQEVWGNQFGDPTAVAVYVQRLRRKIELDPAKPVFLETVFGMGYRLTLSGMNSQETRI